MIKHFLSVIFCCCALLTTAQAKPVKFRIVEDGGTGPYKAVMQEESSLAAHTVFVPQQLAPFSASNPLPVLVWGNGACCNSPCEHYKFLNEIASYGYIVVATGYIPMDETPYQGDMSTTQQQIEAIDWVMAQNADKSSPYCGKIDTGNICLAGMSCGGLQSLFNCADPRIKTMMVCNSGLFNQQNAHEAVGGMPMPPKSKLNDLHTSVLYMLGGEKDIAYQNGMDDFHRISHVPACAVNYPVGHGGTYREAHGGEFSIVALAWLNWQLKGDREAAKMFTGNAPLIEQRKGWTIEKNARLDQLTAGKILTPTMPCTRLNGITERPYTVYLPASYDADTLRRYPVLYLMHGGGESHTVWQQKGHLSEVADRLMRSGEVSDMIIVCPEGNEQNMMYFNAPNWAYEDYFFDEFIPHIERTYRTRTDKGGRAIAGFSMGGGAATVYGVHRPDRFSMVYDISGYLRRQPLEWLKNDPSAEWRQQVIEDNNPIRRIENGTAADVKKWKQVDWTVSVGDHDFTLESNMDFVKALRRQDIGYQMHVSAGEHNWQYVAPAMEQAIRQADRSFRSLWIQNGDRNIYGQLHQPANAKGKMPLAIISHGFNGTHHGGQSYFDALASLGYQTYAFDFPCGSIYSRSDNNTMGMSVIDEKNDLKAIVNYFRQQPYVDASRIVLIGESQGGLVSALTAAELPKEVSQLVLVFPALCIPDDWTSRYPDPAAIPDTTRMWNVPLGRQYFMEVRPLQVFKQIGKFKQPVLIVQGNADPVVKMADSERAVKTYKQARLHVIPGAGHGFKPAEQQENLEQICRFLQEQNK